MFYEKLDEKGEKHKKTEGEKALQPRVNML